MSPLTLRDTGTERGNPPRCQLSLYETPRIRHTAAHQKNKEAVHEASFAARTSSIVCHSRVSGDGDSARPIYRGSGGPCRSRPYSSWALQRVYGRREEQHQADLGRREEGRAHRRLWHLPEPDESQRGRLGHWFRTHLQEHGRSRWTGDESPGAAHETIWRQEQRAAGDRQARRARTGGRQLSDPGNHVEVAAGAKIPSAWRRFRKSAAISFNMMQHGVHRSTCFAPPGCRL